MARIRSIHPGFFTDEAFVQVSAHARLLLLGLGTQADDKGTFPWKPITLKMCLFPMDVVDIQELLKELIGADAIRRYKAEDGKEYGAIRNFREHQRPKSPNDINPIPNDLRNYVGLTDPIGETVGKRSPKTSADGEESSGGDDGEDDGGEGIRRTRARASKLPEDFKPTLTGRAATIAERWPPGRLDDEEEKFRDYHAAKGSTMKDWQAAFRTWITNAETFSARNSRDKPSGWANV